MIEQIHMPVKPENLSILLHVRHALTDLNIMREDNKSAVGLARPFPVFKQG
jgi:hypothetical protein